MTTPAFPGSLILATSVDDPKPSPYFAVQDEDIMHWVHPYRPDEPYREDELTLISVLHDTTEETR